MTYTIRDTGVIEVEITQEMTERAQAKATEMGSLRHSIRKGEGNLAGFLGEEIARAVMEGSTEDNTYNHDLIWRGLRGDVKTKDRTVEPSIDYDASVAAYNKTQAPDFYVFVSLLRNKQTQQYTRGFIMGIEEPTAFKERARYYKKGDIDESNGWVVSIDCYNLPYRKLHSLAELLTPSLAVEAGS